ncbi:hypothetical protein SODALDRAFT_332326 [Sodiomyces alkalinus F11]|uniref:Secreted protein n=1 Tax=Sodiomyces alkalinus (strain CBS 110278 / VKM F-3762 / F11) TaxID=1314773 RepID=A0A3N2PWW2_SODAK|nr:hypothetical protein SODALDRAFT_332326 [Sodiomyces alkalinus F11]ROT38886.1 hypothetical protein SODALDRAFT_332326 [Sodiomyces alkalinus F11]
MYLIPSLPPPLRALVFVQLLLSPVISDPLSNRHSNTTPVCTKYIGTYVCRTHMRILTAQEAVFLVPYAVFVRILRKLRQDLVPFNRPYPGRRPFPFCSRHHLTLIASPSLLPLLYNPYILRLLNRSVRDPYSTTSSRQHEQNTKIVS